MIVVDANVIAYLYLTSERSGQAEQVLVKDPEWAAPLLWRSEFRNVLALYLRRKRLSLPEAQQIMGEATLLMQGREYAVTSEHVLRLTAPNHCSAYDCEYVALARDLSIPLVTADKQVLAEFPDVALAPESFLGSPEGNAS